MGEQKSLDPNCAGQDVCNAVRNAWRPGEKVTPAKLAYMGLLRKDNADYYTIDTSNDARKSDDFGA